MSSYTTYQPDPEDYDLCTLSTCSLQYAMLSYLPTLAGNSIYLALFGLFLLLHLFLGLRFRTGGFLISCTCTCLLEIVGYSGRLMLHANPFKLGTFLLYFIPSALAPAFLTGGIYLVFGRYIIATSRAASRLAPRTYTCAFIFLDLLSLTIQAIGGALTSTADRDAARTQGTNVLIAGLALQVISMGSFILLWAEFAFRLHTKVPSEARNPQFASIRRGWAWSGFPPAMFLALIFIFVRCIYRCVELHQGFAGALANDEVTFMVLEGPMIMIALGLVAVWHPGVAFGGSWKHAAWKLNGKDEEIEEKLSYHAETIS